MARARLSNPGPEPDAPADPEWRPRRRSRRRTFRGAARVARRVCEGAIWTALVLAPAFYGSTAPWALCTLLVLATLALGGATADAYLARRRLTGSLAALALAGMALFIAAQCLPLPPAIIALLSPHADELFRFSLGPRQLYPAWRTLSLDPPGTAVELAKALIEVALFLAASHLCRSADARRRLGAGVALLGAALAAIAFLHQLFGMDSLFGFAHLRRTGLVSPFVNRNHLASALELGALAQLGLTVRTRDKRRAFAWGLGFLFTGAAVLLSGSRAGAISFIAGGLVFAALVWVKGRRGDASALMRHRIALGLCFLAGVVGVATFLNADALLGSLESLSGVQNTHALAKVWPMTVPLVREHWLTGIGRGAFKVAFPHYQTGYVTMTFTHPENVVLQLTSELGLVAGLGLLVVLAGAWAEIARRSDLSPGEGGLLAALFAVGLHEFADFGLELLGVAVPTLLALAVVSTRPSTRRRLPRALGLVTLGMLVIAGGWGLAHTPHEIERDRARVDAALHAGETPEQLSELAWQTLARHPADWVVPLDAALSAARSHPPRPEQALFWSNRAMYLAPLSPWPHRLAAESLFLLGKRSQAMGEESMAMAGMVGDPSFQADLRRFLRTPEEYAQLVPPTPEGAAEIFNLTNDNPKLALAAGELVAVQVTLEVPAMLLQLSTYASRVGDHAKALGYAKRALKAAPTSAQAFESVAGEELALGDALEAEATLRDGLRAQPGELWLSVSLASQLANRKQFDEAHRLLRQITATRPADRVVALETDASIWRAQGMEAHAIASMRDAANLVPDDPNRQYALAQLLLSLGRTREALAAIDRGLAIDHSESHASHAAWRTKISAQAEAEDREQLLKSLDHQAERGSELDDK